MAQAPVTNSKSACVRSAGPLEGTRAEMESLIDSARPTGLPKDSRRPLLLSPTCERRTFEPRALEDAHRGAVLGSLGLLSTSRVAGRGVAPDV